MPRRCGGDVSARRESRRRGDRHHQGRGSAVDPPRRRARCLASLISASPGSCPAGTLQLRGSGWSGDGHRHHLTIVLVSLAPCSVSRSTKPTPPTSTNKSPPTSAAPSPTAKPHPANASPPPKTSPQCSASTPTPCCARLRLLRDEGLLGVPTRPRHLRRRHPRTRRRHHQSPRPRRLRPPTRLHHRRTHPDHQKRHLTTRTPT